MAYGGNAPDMLVESSGPSGSSDEDEGKCPKQDSAKHGTDKENRMEGSRTSEQQPERKANPYQSRPTLTRLTSLDEQVQQKECSGSMNEFAMNAAKQYNELLENLQVWCRIEAEKHVIEATWFQRGFQYLEFAAEFLGAISLAGVGSFMLQWLASDASDKTDVSSDWARIGLVGFVGVLIAGILQFAGKGSANLHPTFQKRSDEHRKVTFAWQLLKHEVKSTRIELRNPDVDVKEVTTMYKQHIAKRKNLSEQILVSKQTSDQIKTLCDLESAEKEERAFLNNWPDDRLRCEQRSMFYSGMVSAQSL
ncbi:hypothetical protein V1264_002962 [Littorina saxatilis]|uniref:Uncharacterized protein n=1 Tax=Littorina saxatilis TaxID=31220 RepID=A0AAN9B402_9CAEN